jgi:hypothetical protein
METVFIQIRAPRAGDPGKVLEGRYNVVGDTVVLVDQTGKPMTSDDRKYSQKLNPGERPKQVAAQMLRAHHNAARGGSPRGFSDKIIYQRVRY